MTPVKCRRKSDVVEAILLDGTNQQEVLRATGSPFKAESIGWWLVNEHGTENWYHVSPDEFSEEYDIIEDDISVELDITTEYFAEEREDDAAALHAKALEAHKG